MIAGFASTAAGLQDTAVVYGLGVVALSLTALVAQRKVATRRRRNSCLVAAGA